MSKEKDQNIKVGELAEALALLLVCSLGEENIIKEVIKKNNDEKKGKEDKN